MEEPTVITEMAKFAFGCKIVCTDGEEGSLVRVIFARGTQRIQALAVRSGLFFSRIVLVPFDAILSATSNGIYVMWTRSQLAAATTALPDGISLDQRSVVHNKDTGDRGQVSLVAVQPESGELMYLVARALRSGQDTLLSRDTIIQLEEDLVTVSLSEQVLYTLPPYRGDRDLLLDVENILFDLTPLHIDFEGITIRVMDGVLYLDGNISSELRGEIVADQSAGVQGLLEVRNNLVGDDQLASDLALALGRDERTRGLPIGVYPRLGIVYLRGVVRDESQRVAAERIAHSFPGVRTVMNELIIKSVTDTLGVMAPASGSDTIDRVPGKYIRHTK